MTRRLAAAVLAGALFASTLPTPPANAAGGPWSMASTTPLVAGAFTSSTAGKDVTVALVNKTSLGDSLQLPVAVTFVLNALGFGGSFSVTATWVPGPGPTLDCPPAVLGVPVDMACVGGGSRGAVLVPGLSRALLLAHAPALTGENQLTAVPTMASLSYDLTVMVVGLVLGVACLDGACGLGADGIRTIALRVMPQAAGAVSALIHNDAATALSELRGLATTVAGMLLKASAAFALGVATAGMLEIKLGIALTKAVLPFINLAAVLVAMQLAGAQGAVTISYTAPTPPPTPRPTPRPTPAPTPTPRPNTSFHVSLPTAERADRWWRLSVGIARLDGVECELLAAPRQLWICFRRPGVTGLHLRTTAVADPRSPAPLVELHQDAPLLQRSKQVAGAGHVEVEQASQRLVGDMPVLPDVIRHLPVGLVGTAYVVPHGATQARERGPGQHVGGQGTRGCPGGRFHDLRVDKPLEHALRLARRPLRDGGQARRIDVARVPQERDRQQDVHVATQLGIEVGNVPCERIVAGAAWNQDANLVPVVAEGRRDLACAEQLAIRAIDALPRPLRDLEGCDGFEQQAVSRR